MVAGPLVAPSGRRRRARTAALAAVLVGGAALAGDPASAAGTGSLTPYLDCVTTNAQSGDVTAYFGYDNTFGNAMTFGVGDQNQAFPVDAFQGQPTYFDQGNYPQVFQVTFSPAVFPGVTWVLDGQEANATPQSPACVEGVTSPATAITADGAEVTGVVVPAGADSGYTFEYGTSGALGSTTPVQAVGGGTQPELVQAALTGLAPRTSYYYRIDADSGSVTTQGQILSFTTPAATPLVIGTRELARATVGTAYTARLAGTGGAAPYLWTLVGGALPAGLRLDPATGVISGVPTARGEARFSVRLSCPGLPGLRPVTRSLHLTVERAW
ncbi:Ig domain-containing protein [Streptacidiphilus sp. P02-A3a]|uniref:Ig domain-containing protein n=1 Tax=Streptacidiphilus sp. P02-A3a TaxID=2704468 RepID=UPI0015FCFF9D|nr:Ig domain-containing protein [Streptacidiphilus sp. P02-A3a]QMU71081.1 hypothetical protein GXP74_25510 [Streptacidiphilus sp. P02-A3a]